MKTIVSGGQTGSDIAAWKVAKYPEFKNHFSTGGWMPCDFATESGSRPLYRTEYGARALEQSVRWPRLADQYRERSKRNVAMSGAVVWIGDSDSLGGMLTKKLAVCQGKDFFTVHPNQREVSKLMVRKLVPLGWVMIGGNRESHAPGIEIKAILYLSSLFTELMR